MIVDLVGKIAGQEFESREALFTGVVIAAALTFAGWGWAEGILPMVRWGLGSAVVSQVGYTIGRSWQKAAGAIRDDVKPS